MTRLAIAALLISAIAATSGYFGALYGAANAPQNLGVALPSGTAVFETSLQDRISSTDTSMTLVSVTTRGSETLTGYQCFTIDEGRTDAEYVCGTMSGSSVTGLERGLSVTTGTTTVAALKFAHRKGASVKITDYPLIQRMRNQLSGTDTINALISYATTTEDCTALSPDDTLCPKEYVDSVAVSGASDANETTKGIVELATALEAASSTLLGSSGARLAIPASVATDTPQACASVGCVVVSQIGGKIRQTFLNLAEAFTWTGLHTWTATTTAATSTINHLGVATTSPSTLAALAVGGDGYFTGGLGIGAATTSDGNLLVSGLSSTTNLVISGTCTGCSMQYTASSTSFNVSSGTVTFTGSIPSWANNALISYKINDVYDFEANIMLARSGLTSQVVEWSFLSGGAKQYVATLSWSGDNFAVTETTDTDSDGSISGTAYWYK